MIELTAEQLKDDIRVLKDAFRNRKVVPLADGVLASYMKEVEDFVKQTNKKNPPANKHSEEDELAVWANQYFIVHRVAASYRQLKTSKLLTKRLEDIGKWNMTPQQQEQFRDSEYELFAAAEFTRHGRRVNFIRDTGKKSPRDKRDWGTFDSRYKKRVEFLVNNRFPVECKRPQSIASIVSNVKKAAEKIAERNGEWDGKKCVAPGVICIALDAAMRGQERFEQYENQEGFGVAYQSAIKQFYDKDREEMMKAMNDTNVQGILFHYDALVYYHDADVLAHPQASVFMKANGFWFAPPAIENGLQALDETYESQKSSVRSERM